MFDSDPLIELKLFIDLPKLSKPELTDVKLTVDNLDIEDAIDLMLLDADEISLIPSNAFIPSATFVSCVLIFDGIFIPFILLRLSANLLNGPVIVLRDHPATNNHVNDLSPLASSLNPSLIPEGIVTPFHFLTELANVPKGPVIALSDQPATNNQEKAFTP